MNEPLLNPFPKYRIPILFLVDVSQSMEGKKIDSINKGLQSLKEKFQQKQSKYRNTQIEIALLTFANKVTVIHPFTPIQKINLAYLSTSNLSSNSMEIGLLTAIDMVGKLKDDHSSCILFPWIFTIISDIDILYLNKSQNIETLNNAISAFKRKLFFFVMIGENVMFYNFEGKDTIYKKKGFCNTDEMFCWIERFACVYVRDYFLDRPPRQSDFPDLPSIG